MFFRSMLFHFQNHFWLGWSRRGADRETWGWFEVKFFPMIQVSMATAEQWGTRPKLGVHQYQLPPSPPLSPFFYISFFFMFLLSFPFHLFSLTPSLYLFPLTLSLSKIKASCDVHDLTRLQIQDVNKRHDWERDGTHYQLVPFPLYYL